MFSIQFNSIQFIYSNQIIHVMMTFKKIDIYILVGKGEYRSKYAYTRYSPNRKKQYNNIPV